jgi:hypothetical protein
VIQLFKSFHKSKLLDHGVGVLMCSNCRFQGLVIYCISKAAVFHSLRYVVWIAGIAIPNHAV